MVVVEITRWPTATRGAARPGLEVLGDIEEPGVDTEIIIRKYGIADEHGDAAIEEAKRLGGAVREKRPASAAPTSARSTTVTIDGEHARDFDDAITIEQLPNGNYWLGVHIADVAHYVPRARARRGGLRARDVGVLSRARRAHVSGGAVHRAVQPEPARRSARAVLPDGDRSARGAVVRYEIHDGVIHSQARMTYTDVNAILTDRDPALKEPRGRRADVRDDARAVRDPERGRRRRGSIDFDLKEPEIILDDEGLVEADHRRRAERRAPDDRGVHAGGERDGRRSTSTRTPCRRSTASTKSPIR